MRLLRWLPALAYAGLIYALSEQPQAAVAEYLTFNFADKLAHAAEYSILGALVSYGLDGRFGPRAWLAATLVAASYGAFDEWHQSWDPSKHRVSSWDDAVADAMGAWLGAYALHRWKHRSNPRGAPS
jgi:VanZ family protein